MLRSLFLLSFAWAAVHAEPTCDGNGEAEAKGTSLLSFKADAVKALDTRSIYTDVVSNFMDNGTATNSTNSSWQRVNQSLHDLAACQCHL
eukprot:Skav205850  [mRNA]  locus=scaffold766:42374:42643:+ [translate_table: standard]